MTAWPPPLTADAGPAAALAEGFARQLQRWALARGATPAAAAAALAAARALSLATSNGHACLSLGELGASGELGEPDDAGPAAVAAPDARPRWRAALRASGVVGSARHPAGLPLVLDDEDRLYLHRFFDFEQRLARRLARCLLPQALDDADPAVPLAAQACAQLAALFPGHGGPRPDWQQIAAALALGNRLTVISGGPGTGKTTTVARLLACLLAQQPDARVVLAAPTGKAAARLSQALHEQAARLGDALRARLPVESFTLHRLLGVRPEGAAERGNGGDGGFIHHAGNQLALDVLVVDEASMLDLALATRLLEAVPERARIILLGDKDQLAAVESGAVFAELSADPTLGPACRARLGALCGLAPEAIEPAAPLRPGALHDAVVWFDRNYRFAADSGIGRLAGFTVAGQHDQALAWLKADADSAVHWLDDSSALPQPATLAAIHDGFAPYLAALRAGLGAPITPAAIAAIAQAFAAFRVLCAVREGPRGVAAVNAAVTLQLRQALGSPAPRSPWFAGRPVMVLRNDPASRLFNGDIGLTLPDASGALAVYFPAADGGFRAVAPSRLPPHQTAFAMTVHKAQGSEFGAVLVLLPAQRSRVLSRELLYTAITRARERVWLAGGAEVLAAAIGSATQRQSGLQARLREALAAPPP